MAKTRKRLGCNSGELLSEDPSATAALEKIFFSTVKCPYCDLYLPRADLNGQIDHLETQHPDRVRVREQEIDRLQDFTDDQE